MKSLVHCAVQMVLNGSAKIAKAWEPSTKVSWDRNERCYSMESRMSSFYYSWEPVWRTNYPHKEYFDTPILELYGDRWQEGVIEHIYQKVGHVIEPAYNRQISAFDPFFDGCFSYSVKEWCRMLYPMNKGPNDVPQEVLDKMAETGCFGPGWLDYNADIPRHSDIRMKKEFEFKNHKPNSKRKHYFAHRSQ